MKSMDFFDESFDAKFKRLMKRPEFISPIIKEAVKDFKSFTHDEIFEAISKSSISGEVTLLAEEDIVTGEAKICYDAYLNLDLPRIAEDIMVSIVLDLEMQHNKPSYYVLENRAQYYAARLLSRQIKTVGNGEAYNKLRPVYTIWIVKDPYEDQQNKVREFELRCDEGSFNELGSAKSLIHVVMVYLPKFDTVSDNDLINYLLSIFSKRYDKSDLTKFILNNSEIKKEVEAIMTIEEAVERRGIQIGEERGIRKGIQKGIQIGAQEVINLLTPEEKVRVQKQLQELKDKES